MIARVWKGQTTGADIDAYRAYIRETGLSDYRRCPGNRGAFLFTSLRGETADVMTVSLWDSYDSVRQFAGENIAVARFYPRDVEYLIAADSEASHYEVDV